MKLKYFKEKSYNDLYDSITDNLEKYQNSSTPWLDTFFNNAEYVRESKINALLPELYSKKNEDDIVDVRNLYNALKNEITPKQASNELLWAYLSHTQYWAYTQQRWKSENKGSEFIKNRFFCGNTKDGKADRRGLLHNSVSRLYWYGYLTYQEDYARKYELTEVLLSRADLCLNIMERNYSMNRCIVKGMLKAIKQYDDICGIEEEEWRNLCKYINRHGAVTLLDIMSEYEIYELSIKYLMDNSKKKDHQ